MEKKERLRKVIENLKMEHGLTNEALSLSLGYRSGTYVSDILSGGKKAGKLFLERLKEYYKINPEYIENGGPQKVFISYSSKDKKLEKPISRETNESEFDPNISDGEASYRGDKEKYNARSIYNLTESNRVIAESNASLARSHEELVAMLKNSIAYARPKITVDDASTRTDFLELIARIGSGEKIWNSRAEADAALSKFVLVPNMGDTKEDTRAGSGKGHKKLDS
jgi:hypothetical protein